MERSQQIRGLFISPVCYHMLRKTCAFMDIELAANCVDIQTDNSLSNKHNT